MKRFTKAQLRERGIAALERRLLDLMLGTVGGYAMPTYDGEDCPGLANELGIEGFGRWVGAIRQEWNVRVPKEQQGKGNRLPDFFFEPDNLEAFDDFHKLAETMYDGYGCRA